MKWPFRTSDKTVAQDTRSNEGFNNALSVSTFGELFFSGNSSDAGVNVNRSTALSVPAYWQAVNFLSSTIASLPLYVYRNDDGVMGRLRGGVENILNRAVSSSMTSFSWRKKIMTDLLTGGRHCSLIVRDRGGRVINIVPLDPSRVSISLVNGEKVYRYLRGADNSSQDSRRESTYTSSDIIDVVWLYENDCLTHIDPIRRLRNTLGLSIAMESYAARFFKSGGIPPASLEGPAMSPAAAERAAVDFKRAFSHASKDGRPIMLPPGYKITPVGVDPEKAQMNDARRFQIEEIARMVDIPPVFLHDLTKGTFNNTEQSALNLVKHTLRQWLVLIEQELDLKLFGFENDEGFFVKHDVDNLLRGDFKGRMEGLAKAVQNAILTPNEARETENREPKDGGDGLQMQQNMSIISALTNRGDSDEQ